MWVVAGCLLRGGWRGWALGLVEGVEGRCTRGCGCGRWGRICRRKWSFEEERRRGRSCSCEVGWLWVVAGREVRRGVGAVGMERHCEEEERSAVEGEVGRIGRILEERSRGRLEEVEGMLRKLVK